MDLDVSSNRLAALPPAISALQRLRYLNAMNNRLAALPEGIGACTALLRLGLKSNRLATLPPSIGQLGALVELYLTGELAPGRYSAGGTAPGRYSAGGTGLRAPMHSAGPPPHQSAHTHLTRPGPRPALTLAHPRPHAPPCPAPPVHTDNVLHSLPAEVGQLRSLVKLQASFNPALTSLPAELGGLPNLEMLRVASCGIAEVPARLADAPKLAWMRCAGGRAYGFS